MERLLTEGKTYRYMPQKDFVVYYYSDDEVPEIPLHYHEFYELLFFVDGNLDYIVEDQIYHLEKGDLLFIPPGVFHNPIIHNFDIPYERYVLWISVFAMNKLFELDENINMFKAGDTEKLYLIRSRAYVGLELQAAFRSLFNSYEAKNFCYKSEGYSIIMYILTMYNREINKFSTNIVGGTKDDLISNIVHYINTNITEELSLDKISAEFYINKYTISRKFKSVMKISFYQYVIQKRLSVGKEYLIQGVNANEVFKLCGFNDYVSFYRAFKKEYNVSPNKFKIIHNEIMSNE